MLNLLGIIGSIMALAAYFGYSAGHFKAKTFHILNLGSGISLFAVAAVAGIPGFMLLNLAWVVIALRGLRH